MSDQPRPRVCPECHHPTLLLNMVVQATPFDDGLARPVGNPVLPLDPLPGTPVTCNADGCRWQGIVTEAVDSETPFCPECRQPEPDHHPSCPNS